MGKILVMDVRELMKLEVDPAEVEAIYELWKQHSIAEDNRDIAALLATLTDDCVYQIIGEAERWEGHEGATRFYTGLLTAFPDIHFDLTDIVVGPQGVCEEAEVAATHERNWLDWEASGERIEFRVVIFFPWDRGRRLFRGEKVYVYADGRVSPVRGPKDESLPEPEHRSEEEVLQEHEADAVEIPSDERGGKMSDHEHTEPAPDEREEAVEDLAVPEDEQEDVAGGAGHKLDPPREE